MVRKSLALAAALCALVAAACGSGEPVFNGNKLEQQISRRLEREKVNLKSISCPDGRPLKKDDAFECTAVARTGARLPFAVRQIDDKGRAEWSLKGRLLDVRVVQETIQTDFEKVPPPQGPLNVTVTCAHSGTIALAYDDSVRCEVKNTNPPHDTTQIRVTAREITQNEREFDWAPEDAPPG